MAPPCDRREERREAVRPPFLLPCAEQVCRRPQAQEGELPPHASWSFVVPSAPSDQCFGKAFPAGAVVFPKRSSEAALAPGSGHGALRQRGGISPASASAPRLAMAALPGGVPGERRARGREPLPPRIIPYD